MVNNQNGVQCEKAKDFLHFCPLCILGRTHTRKQWFNLIKDKEAQEQLNTLWALNGIRVIIHPRSEAQYGVVFVRVNPEDTVYLEDEAVKVVSVDRAYGSTVDQLQFHRVFTKKQVYEFSPVYKLSPKRHDRNPAIFPPSRRGG